MPKPGTVCEADLGPFDPDVEISLSVEDAQGRLHINEEDRQLLSAIRELSSRSQFTNFYPRFSSASGKFPFYLCIAY